MFEMLIASIPLINIASIGNSEIMQAILRSIFLVVPLSGMTAFWLIGSFKKGRRRRKSADAMHQRRTNYGW